MHGKYERRDEGASDAGASEHQRQQKRRQHVQPDIDEVITGRLVAEEAMLDPEGRVRERVVLLRRAELRPDAPESADRLQLRPRHVMVIVPQHAAVPDGLVSERHDEDEEQELRLHAFPWSARSILGSCFTLSQSRISEATIAPARTRRATT